MVPQNPSALILLDQVKIVGLMTKDEFIGEMNDRDIRVTRTTTKGFDRFLPSDYNRFFRELQAIDVENLSVRIWK